MVMLEGLEGEGAYWSLVCEVMETGKVRVSYLEWICRQYIGAGIGGFWKETW